jgi:regulator of sirC expression with transglutaminase-like and TPR domain
MPVVLGTTQRFIAMVQGPEDDLRLDEAALLLAAHARPNLDVAAELGRLDELASRCPGPTVDGLSHLLFDQMGFTGATEDYGDPRNSFLDQVLDRRVGIPISLAVLMIEVGRRAGVALEGVGMPGHFLVRPASDRHVLIDPYHRGNQLDADECGGLFRALFGADAVFSPALLQVARPRAILARMLANLKRSYAERSDAASLVWASRLRVAIPGVPVMELAELSEALVKLGRFGEAADALEDLAIADGSVSEKVRMQATVLRARLN